VRQLYVGIRLESQTRQAIGLVGQYRGRKYHVILGCTANTEDAIAMEVKGLGWLGIRTERFEETAQFFRDVMGLEVTWRERDVVGFRFPDGTEMEVWRPEDDFHNFFTTGPVVGFRVDDIDEARARMEATGIKFIGPVQRSGDASWNHFRGPDGNVYEIYSRS
jgi:catechol 2,3-dioxygenase-like lactoylglutathione lyase family enzyme